MKELVVLVKELEDRILYLEGKVQFLELKLDFQTNPNINPNTELPFDITCNDITPWL